MSPRRAAEDVFAPLIEYLRARYPLSDEHAELVRSLAAPVRVARGVCLQRAGDVARDTFFVAKGLLRAFVLEEDGHEHIVRFAAEGWWLGDPESARLGTPSRMSFEAIEPSIALRIARRDHDRLLEVIPGHAIAFAKGLQGMVAARERWILGTLSDTAEKRYEDFLAAYAGIASRVPQWMIASYLGLAPETLSRVRRARVERPRDALRAPRRPPRGSGSG